MTSYLVKKHPNENNSNHSVDGGLIHSRALLTFYTAEHQMVSFIEMFNVLRMKENSKSSHGSLEVKKVEGF